VAVVAAERATFQSSSIRHRSQLNRIDWRDDGTWSYRRTGRDAPH
jgi:hypothetical protein